jgi:hypothetical protein
VIATFLVGSNPGGLAVSPTGTFAGDIYITNPGANTVSVIQPGGTLTAPTFTVIGTIALPSFTYPDGVAVSPTGTFAGDVYVSDGNLDTVSVIQPGGTVNAPTFTVIDTITVGLGPRGVAVAPVGSPNAGDVYVTTGSGVSVIGPSNTVTTVGISGTQGGVAVTPGNGDIYVSFNVGSASAPPLIGGVSVISPSTNTVATTITAGIGYYPYGVAVAT